MSLNPHHGRSPPCVVALKGTPHKVFRLLQGQTVQNTLPLSTVPKGIKIYLWVTACMALFFSALAYVKPELQFATWPTLKADGALLLSGPMGLYVARNLATVAAVVVALISGQASAIRAALVLRLVTDGLDCLHNGLAANLPGAGFAGVMFAIEWFALYKMRGMR